MKQFWILDFGFSIGRAKSKKDFPIAICGLFLFLASVLEAQQSEKIPRIGFIDSGSASDPMNALGVEALRQGLRELGYVEGKNINIDYRYDEGKPGRLQQLAEELVRLKVDILLAMTRIQPEGRRNRPQPSQSSSRPAAALLPVGLWRVSPDRAAMLRGLQPIPRSWLASVSNC